MNIILALIIGIILIGLLVFLHEAGHFFMAKFFKVKVEEFGFGFPPRVWGKKVGETVYSINAIPAGGFVKLFGEDEGGSVDQRSFVARSPWVRSAIIVAGVVVNLIIAFLLFTALLAYSGFRSDQPLSIPTSGQDITINFPFGKQTDGVLIVYVQPKTPAARAGLQDLDEVTSANGKTFSSIGNFQKFVEKNKGKEINIQVFNLLDRQNRSISVTPRLNPPKDEAPLGVVLDKVATIRYEGVDKFFVGPMHAVNMLFYQGKIFIALFGEAFEQKSVQPVAQTVSGPIGIAGLIGTFIGVTGTKGIFTLVEVIALISLILGVINVLPLPALDGGRLFFTLFEGISGKKVNQKIERLIHSAGYIVIIIFFFIITYNDIIKIFR